MLVDAFFSGGHRGLQLSKLAAKIHSGDGVRGCRGAGARVAGSVLSAVIVPRSVAGSLAPQSAPFTVPTAVFLVDKRP